jgi:putative ATPase
MARRALARQHWQWSSPTVPKAEFEQINATVAGKKEMEQVIEHAKSNLGAYGRKTILFIDEIHRFNKAQQDYLLPYVEDGTVILIGATTENPYFEVNGALLSRSRIFELHSLDQQAILTLISRAVSDPIKGIAGDMVKMDEDAMTFLADVADGDARAALNALELADLTTERSDDGYIHITLPVAEECIQKKAVRYDKTGTIITIQSQLSSNQCADQIRMQLSITLHACCRQEKMSSSSPEES